MLKEKIYEHDHCNVKKKEFNEEYVVQITLLEDCS